MPRKPTKEKPTLFHVARHMRPMWVALDSKGRMQATWYRNCVQPWHKWRDVVLSMGWRPLKVTIVFPY